MTEKPFASLPVVHPPRLLEMTCGWPDCNTRFQFYLADSAVCPVCIRRSIVLFQDVDSGNLEPTKYELKDFLKEALPSIYQDKEITE